MADFLYAQYSDHWLIAKTNKYSFVLLKDMLSINSGGINCDA